MKLQTLGTITAVVLFLGLTLAADTKTQKMRYESGKPIVAHGRDWKMPEGNTLVKCFSCISEPTQDPQGSTSYVTSCYVMTGWDKD